MNQQTPGDGFTVLLPGMLSFYQLHGGPNTLGQPLSNDFQLLGKRVQIFERQVLEQQSDGSVQPMDVLGAAMPLTHAGGATFPSADPDVMSNIPALGTPDYQAQALAAIDGGLLDWAAPDSWNDLPVNFGSTFRATLACDQFSATPCDDRRALAAAVDVWGLPTSYPTADPNNADLVYLRFQRGIMQFSQSTGQTTAVPIGAWFKRVLIGTDVPDDLTNDVVGSRYYAQYAPSLPLGVARPSELPTSSLATAFSPRNTFTTAGVQSFGQAAPTPVFAPALPTFSPSAAGSNGQNSLNPSSGQLGATASSSQFGGTPLSAQFGATTSTTTQTDQAVGGLPNVVGTPTANGTPVANGTPGAVPVANGTPGAVPAQQFASTVATPTTPMGPDPCAGDEQILFSPKKPYVGTDVLVAVTSATHHDVRTVRLTGPVKTGTVTERPGLNGWVWEWTISPTIEGWYEFTFYVDDARACSTSGFNALPAFGATPVPSPTTLSTTSTFSAPTPIATLTPLPTATPAPAPSFAASVAADPASGACPGRLLRLNGENFGSSQAALGGNVLFSGGAGGSLPATVFSWTNNSILVTIPTAATPGVYQLVVTTTSGFSNPLAYTVGACTTT